MFRRPGASLAVVLIAAACTGTGEAEPVATPPSTGTTSTTVPPITTTTSVPIVPLEDVDGQGPACANTTAADGTVRPVYTWDCPVTAAAWQEADYNVKGRTGVLGWLYEDDPDGICGFPGAYYECHQGPMRATLGGVLLGLEQTSIEYPVWDEASSGYVPLQQDLWVATFYLGDRPGEDEPIVGRFLLSAPGLGPDGDTHPSRWRVCLQGNLFGGGEVSCLQAPPREISTGRMARQVLQVGRGYAFTVFYTFDPERAFADTDPKFREDAEAWERVVGDWVSWVSYTRELRALVQGEPGSGLRGPGLILDVVLDEIPDEAA